ncbi:hypothetical protein ACIP1G_28230 [Pseudomonas sp. NPDC089392]|uniref:hypothetical protein n=1 Tax=Pseudomonas sp. NPDC089392 TaxID=3364459 RepID=UPI0038053016
MIRLMLIALLATALPLSAAPAPFYLWQSLVTGRYLCSAHNPGKGWVRHAGPYNNAGCRSH